MTAFTEKLDRAAGAALCEGLQQAGGALVGAGAVSLVFGGPVAVPIALGTAALMASVAGCTWDSAGGGGPQNGGPPGLTCMKGSGTFSFQRYDNGVLILDDVGITEVTEIVYGGILPGQISGAVELWTINYLRDGQFAGSFLWVAGSRDGVTTVCTQTTSDGFVCNEPVPVPQPPDVPQYDYTDPVDGCKLTVNIKGWSTDGNGNLNPVFKMEPAPEVRADGGVIGGCNFEPVIYTGSPGGPGEPPIIGPWNPDWDIPGGPLNPWLDFLRKAAAGVVGETISNAIQELLEAPKPPVKYELFSQCEVDAQGDPEQRVVEVSIPAIKGDDAIIARIDALVPLLQGQKDFKQPICPPEKLQGEFRTIGFISENRSPNGRDYLRKRLRYRSVSGIGQDALIDHWKSFEFDAGPVITKHRGASWGTVTVWAASADEGKRVIRHAAAEALINVDRFGRWEIGGSSSTRLGMSGRMKVNTKGGYYWITNRDGSDNRPRVGTTRSDLISRGLTQLPKTAQN